MDAYRKNPASLDRNGDGVVSYVLLEGETNHQDSLIRTEWSVQTLKDGGVPIRRITSGIANWERNQASALMEEWLSDYWDEIELVICNNDDMAIGAIDAIEREGIMAGTIKLVGIDGTPAGQEAFREGKLFRNGGIGQGGLCEADLRHGGGTGDGKRGDTGKILLVPAAYGRKLIDPFVTVDGKQPWIRDW